MRELLKRLKKFAAQFAESGLDELARRLAIYAVDSLLKRVGLALAIT